MAEIDAVAEEERLAREDLQWKEVFFGVYGVVKLASTLLFVNPRVATSTTIQNFYTYLPLTLSNLLFIFQLRH
ncbi:uncharacterized protein BT62DRAFT_383952 [Guyanagaster necrorhizus]|uniref:Uncharacterized protein n=1 Tax=Guyanagaster necrorhizus TaxID=856835 RepID=A0A9P7VKX7_9AGAR|nr:uncharacterized protein BT62DRAFT_383952 [Guyanagaster necrorhizus MCA 3950]KAG7442463.1 hypothetical protein BT62DRAFT_383952 [Guyanagaster necrorhizus MCA 3950]